MTPLRRLILPLLLALAALNPGCAGRLLTPRTEALRTVHDNYQREFAELNLPSASAEPAAPSSTNAPPFTATLSAIRAFRLAYPGDSSEAAHLKVLEGMVYLQSGRFGLATAVAPDVQAAGAQLRSQTGRVVRDALFARNFTALLKGWSEIREFADGSSSTVAEWRELDRAAQAIKADLESIPASQLADPDTDQGALYLANTAAIFNVWAFKLLADEDLNAARQRQAAWFGGSADLLGRFLTDAEKRDVAASDLGSEAPGRLRSVHWFHWLNRRGQGHSG